MLKATCAYEGCDRPSERRGYCGTHYHRLRGIGELVNLPKLTAPERFFAKVNKGVGDGCWLWTAGCSSTGYGSFDRGGHRMCPAHIWSYEYHVGPVPPGLELDHLCRVHRCVNPNHLEAVTHQVNMLRGGGRNFETWRTNICHRGHSMEDAYHAHRSNGTVSRRCRTCHRELESRRKRDTA